MHHRQPLLPDLLSSGPLPRRWLMTDERMGEGLWAALARLPAGSGVVFRHYGLPLAERRALFKRVRAVTRRRRLVLVVAGREWMGRVAAGTHGRHHGALTAPVHSRIEAVAAVRAGARLLFVSPVFSTRSHVGVRGLGRVRLGLMVRGLGVPVVTLGGMSERRWRGVRALGVYGWAGIDAWVG